MIINNIDNPFVVYGYAGPEYFCDRKEETQALIDTLMNGGNVTLMSPRRMGKTGLILNAFHQIEKQYSNVTCFYVDIFATQSLSDFVSALANAIIGKLDTPIQRAEGFLARFFQNSQITMSADPITGMPQWGLSFQPQEAQVTLDKIFAYIEQSSRTCFIALDEFQQISKYEEKNIESLLRTYIQAHRNVRFIFSGSKQHMMFEMFTSPKHPFYRSTECQNLAALNEAVYYEFAQERLSIKHIQLDADLFHEIYQRFDGVTWFVQEILNRLYRLEEGTYVDDAIWHDCLERIIFSQAENYRCQYKMLTRNQALLLSAIAKERCVKEPMSGQFIHRYNLKSSSSVQRAFQFLMEEEFIYETDNGYIVYDRFMSLWLAKER